MDFLKRLFGAKPANASMNIPAPANIGAAAPKLPESNATMASNAVVGGKRRNTRRRKNSPKQSRKHRKNSRK